MGFDDDDLTIGTIYSRRKALTMLGGAVVLAACGGDGTSDLGLLAETNVDLPSGCVVRPALSEGPIFVDEQANRSDIRTDPLSGSMSEGTPLTVTFRVSTLDGTTCDALAGAQVDLWQCDAFGVYSDTDFDNMDTVGQQFLRGHQVTDASGEATFITIYPGWYPSRAVHLHFKVRTDSGEEFTSQLFFDPATTDAVFATAPYNTRGERPVRNADDGTAVESGDQMILNAQPTSSGDGYEAIFDITLDVA